MVGAAEDAAKQVDPVAADAKMALARPAGFDTIRMTSVWSPSETEIAGGELVGLQNAVAAASLNGIPPDRVRVPDRLSDDVVGLLFFHVSDESDLDRWQSGVYYADDTPKSDLPVVAAAADLARIGKLVASCRR
jgi:hypothetical protein